MLGQLVPELSGHVNDTLSAPSETLLPSGADAAVL